MKNYPLYKHPNITNFKQIIEMNAKSAPTNSAFRYRDGKQIVSVTYEQFQADVYALSAYFLQEGLRGAKIAVVGENSYPWILTYFATVLSGNVIVPLDKELPTKDIADLLHRCSAAALVYADTYSDIGSAMLQDKCVNTIFNMKDFPGFIQIGQHLLETSKSTLSQLTVDENAVCSIIFTSGTTGNPKGVMLTQRSLVIDAVSACRNVYFYGPGLLTLPLHHTFAFTATVLVLMVYGLPICISRSIRTLTADMQTFKPQSIALVPLYVETIYNGIWKTARTQGKEKLLKTMIGILRRNVYDPDYIPQKKSMGDILLTGATGFLGSHILDQIMQRESGRIYCLVRGDGQRLFDILRYYFGEKYTDSNRVSVAEVKVNDVKKSIGIPIAKDKLSHVTYETVCAAIKNLENRSYRDIEQLRREAALVASKKENLSPAKARRYAFLVQQHINAQLFNSSVKTMRQAFGNKTRINDYDWENFGNFSYLQDNTTKMMNVMEKILERIPSQLEHESGDNFSNGQEILDRLLQAFNLIKRKKTVINVPLFQSCRSRIAFLKGHNGDPALINDLRTALSFTEQIIKDL